MIDIGTDLTTLLFLASSNVLMRGKHPFFKSDHGIGHTAKKSSLFTKYPILIEYQMNLDTKQQRLN